MNRGHEVGCPALRDGVPCTCWAPAAKIDPATITHFLGKPVRYWIDVDAQLKARGYDRLLDGFMEQLEACRLGREADRSYRQVGIDNLHARIRELEARLAAASPSDQD